MLFPPSGDDGAPGCVSDCSLELSSTPQTYRLCGSVLCQCNRSARKGESSVQGESKYSRDLAGGRSIPGQSPAVSGASHAVAGRSNRIVSGETTLSGLGKVERSPTV